jgi:hypothetical protein
MSDPLTEATLSVGVFCATAGAAVTNSQIAKKITAYRRLTKIMMISFQ